MDLSSDEEEAVPLSALKARIKSNGRQRPPPTVELSSSDDEGDSLLLSSMKKKMIRKAAKKKAQNSKNKSFTAKRSTVKRGPAKKKARTTKRTGRSSTASEDDNYLELFRSKSFKASAVLKTHLVEGILIRWKYVIDWPPKSAILQEPPKGYIMLRGYKGVYVGIHGEHCGKIIDNRADRADIPSFDNLFRKPATALKNMLQEAIQRQAQDLKDHDGPQRLLSDLATELKNLAKVNTAKLDSR